MQFHHARKEKKSPLKPLKTPLPQDLLPEPRHLELLHLAAARQGHLSRDAVLAQPEDVRGGLVSAELELDPFPDLGVGGALAGGRRLAVQEGGDGLAVMGVLEAGDDGAGDAGVRHEALLDLERVDVLAAADDDVLEAARDGAVAPVVEDGLVARVQPQHARPVAHHDLGRLLRVVPVPRLQLVAGDAELAAGADGDHVALVVDDLGARVRHQRPHRRQPLVHGVVREGVEARRRRLRQPVAARELGHAEPRDQQLHQVPGNGRAGDDARPEVVAVETGGCGQAEECVEHGRHAVDGCALLVGNGAEHGGGVEGLLRVDDLGSVGDDGHQAEHQAEAVEQGRRAA